MLAQALHIKNHRELRTYVNETLCHCHHLETDAFPLTERPLLRRGRPCGILFCLHGPRQVTYTAIWESVTNSVLFYGASGQRLHKARLSERLAPRPVCRA